MRASLADDIVSSEIASAIGVDVHKGESLGIRRETLEALGVEK